MAKDVNGNEITDGQDNDDAGSDRTDDTNTGGDDQSNSGDGYPDGLGDAGKRAIDRMKAERDESWRRLRERDAEIRRLKAAQTSDRNGGKDDKVSDDQATSAVFQDVTQQTEAPGKSAEEIVNERMREFHDQATARLLRSEIKAAASDKLSDPSDALKFLDQSEFTAGEDGEFDSAAIAAAVDKLLTDRPYLAAFQGSAEGGPRGDGGSARGQLSQEEYESMSFVERSTARKEGRLNDVLGIK